MTALFGVDVSGARTLNGLGFAAASAAKQLQFVGLAAGGFAGVMGLAGVAVAALGAVIVGVVGLLGVGLAGGFIAAGIAAAAMSAQVKSAFADVKKQVTDVIKETSGPVNTVVANLLHSFGDTVTKLKPQIAQTFQTLAPIIGKFGTDAIGAFEYVVKGANHTLQSVAPLISIVGDHLIPLLHGLGQAGHNAYEPLQRNVGAFGQFLTMIERLLPLLGSFIGAFVDIGIKALPAVSQGLQTGVRGLTDFVKLVGGLGLSILPAFGKALGDIGHSFMTGLASVIPATTAALNQFLPAMGSLAQSLFPALATVLRAVLPVLAQVIDGLVKALGPVLPIIGNSVGGLATNFGQLFSAITPLLGTVAQLAGWLTVVSNNLVVALAPVLAHMIQALTPGLNDILGRVYQLANVVGGQLAGAFHTAEPGLVALAHAASNLLTAAGPLLTFVGQLSGILLGAFGQALNTWAQGMATILNLLSPFAPLIVGIVVAVKEWSRVQLLLNLAQNSSPLQRWIVVLGLAVGWFTQAHGWVKLLAGAVLAITAAITLWTAAQWAWNAAMSSTILQQIYANSLVLIATIRRWAHTVATIASTVAHWAAVAATAAWAAIQWVLNAALNANPIGIVIIAVAALAVGIFLLIKHWQAVVDFLHSKWGTAISAAVAVIFPFIGIPLLIIGHWQAILHFFQGLWSAVSGFFSKHWGLILAVVFPFVGLPLLIIRHWGAITGFFSRLWHDVAGFFVRMWTDVSGFALRIARDVAGFFARMWRDVTGFVSRIWHDVTGFFSRMWNDVYGFFARGVKIEIELIVRLWRDVTGFVSRIWHDVVGFFARMWNDVYGYFARGIRAEIDLITRLWRDVTGWVSRLWHDVVNLFSRLWGDVTGWVSRLWRDVTGFISRMWHDVVGFISNLWHDITGWFSRIWHDVTDIWNRFTDGITRITRDVTSVISGIFSAFWDGLKRGFDDVKSAIGKIWDGVKHVVGAPVKVIVDVIYEHGIRALWSAIIGKIPGVPDLPHVEMPGGWFTGGAIPGFSQRDDRLIPVAGGEHVLTSEEVRAAGGHGAVAKWRSSLLGGRSVRAMGGDDGFIFGGGIVSDVGHLASGAVHAVGNVAGDVLGAATGALGDVLAPLAHLVRGALASLVEPAVHGLEGVADRTIEGKEGWQNILRGGVHQIGDAIINFVRDDDTAQNSALAGPGESFGLIIEYAKKSGIPIGAVTTKGGQHVQGSYHYAGQAVDFGNSANPNQRGIYDWFGKIAEHLLELFWDPGGRYVKNGKWIPGAIGGHGDHVHVAASVQQMLQVLGRGGGAPIPPGPLRDMVQAGLNARGWGNQFASTDFIISHESGWRVGVKNPGSTATGLFQLLYNSGNGASEEINNGLNYIAGRYGSPDAAAAFWRAHGWYEAGTSFVPQDGLYGLHRGERVVTAADNKAGVGDHFVFNLDITVQGGDGASVAGEIAREVEGQLQQVVGRIRAGRR